MPELEEDEKAFVVQKLACFYTLGEVSELLKEEYGKDAPSNQLARYNPTLKAGATLSDRFKQQFEQDRAAYLEGKEVVPIDLQHFRSRELMDMYRKLKEKKNYVVAAQMLQQAAKDAGGLFSNRREVTGPGGKPLVPDAPSRAEAGKELDEWRKQMTEQLAQNMNPPE